MSYRYSYWQTGRDPKISNGELRPNEGYLQGSLAVIDVRVYNYFHAVSASNQGQRSRSMRSGLHMLLHDEK